MKTLLILLVLCGACYATSIKEHHITDGVGTVYDIPYNECRMVTSPPSDVLCVELHLTKLMCNTLGVVPNEDLMVRKD